MSEDIIKRRYISVFIFVAGLLIGIFDGPAYWNAVMDKLAQKSGIADIQLLKLEGGLFRQFRLGLDLQGGTHLIYEADLKDINSTQKSDSMAALRDVIERRVNLFGVSEPVVQVEKTGDSWRLIVELARIKDLIGDFNSALESYKKIIELNPNHEQIHLIYEKIFKKYQKRKNYDSAAYYAFKTVEMGGKVDPKTLEFFKKFKH